MEKPVLNLGLKIIGIKIKMRIRFGKAVNKSVFLNLLASLGVSNFLCFVSIAMVKIKANILNIKDDKIFLNRFTNYHLLCRVIDEHLFEEIHAISVQGFHGSLQIEGVPVGEACLNR